MKAHPGHASSSQIMMKMMQLHIHRTRHRFLCDGWGSYVQFHPFVQKVGHLITSAAWMRAPGACPPSERARR